MRSIFWAAVVGTMAAVFGCQHAPPPAQSAFPESGLGNAASLSAHKSPDPRLPGLPDYASLEGRPGSRASETGVLEVWSSTGKTVQYLEADVVYEELVIFNRDLKEIERKRLAKGQGKIAIELPVGHIAVYINALDAISKPIGKGRSQDWVEIRGGQTTVVNVDIKLDQTPVSSPSVTVVITYSGGDSPPIEGPGKPTVPPPEKQPEPVPPGNPPQPKPLPTPPIPMIAPKDIKAAYVYDTGQPAIEFANSLSLTQGVTHLVHLNQCCGVDPYEHPQMVLTTESTALKLPINSLGTAWVVRIVSMYAGYKSPPSDLAFIPVPSINTPTASDTEIAVFGSGYPPGAGVNVYVSTPIGTTHSYMAIPNNVAQFDLKIPLRREWGTGTFQAWTEFSHLGRNFNSGDYQMRSFQVSKNDLVPPTPTPKPVDPLPVAPPPSVSTVN